MTEQQTALVIRPRRALIMCSVLAVALLAAFVVVAVLLRSSHTGVVFEASDQIAMIGIGVALSAGTMLFGNARVRADATGIEVRNVLARRVFTWDQVLSISFPDGASWARLELPDDEYFSVMAVQAVDRERAVTAVRALRRLHRAATEA
ncbi:MULTISPECIES: PH domain-containing protein [Amycolatopsis]|uniref:PH domain-containing protein n=1 Tax=Amycolatopsis TaxID=1813 RepID=UPI000567D3D2|nr:MULTISPECIES: PH domain-containing protein [Amycolatopsis]MCG3755918.1 PH domain-containing protein [Amycolatopsis sp. Poz14]